MAAYSNFRSSSQIEAERDELRAARRAVLDKAKHDYERTERRKEKAKLAGEGTWMLQSVTDRIDKEQKAMEKMKKKKKEKKKKKKQKKEKKKKRQSSSSESDSSDEEPSWIEKSSEPNEEIKKVAGPSLQRDSWMDGPLVTDIIPTVTRAELREQKRAEEEKKKAETVNLMDQPGQHTRELNPYWKDGGTGLPEEKPKHVVAAPSAAGDGGLSWLRKAYDRCKQQAEDEGRSLEEVAAERYGSLEKLESMIREAEKQSRPSHRQQHDQRYHRDDQGYRHSRSLEGQPRGNGNNDDRYRGDSDRASGRERDRDSRENRDRDSRETDSDRKQERERSDRDRGREGDRRRDRDDGERERTVRSGTGKHGDRDSRSLSFSRDSFSPSSSKRQFARPREDSDEEPSQKKRTFMRPGGDSESFQRRQPTSSSLKGRFAKPSDSDGDDDVSSSCRRLDAAKDRGVRDVGRSSGGGGGGWRKQKETKTQERSSPKAKKSRRSPSSSSSSSSSSDSESDKEDGRDEEEREEEPAPVRLLTEDEMNSIGAKILRAELMGDEDLANQLKEQLEQARQAKNAAPRSQPGPKITDSKVKDKEDNTVVLTRTGRDGMVRPLPEQEYDRDRSSGKRKRKMKNVTTHGQGGERTKYFDDDDRHDLKTLVQMEKLGTAEDQNAMFARLAGRNAEKTDDDFQVDDMFVSKAARQQSGAVNEEKERSKAIFEHRKVSKAVEKCQYCFNKVPKHLIIAIGSKVYLSLPAHRSLTPGHCLIVPMQHSSAATALDEDVWQEMQTFRKQLVQMFASQDQDVVFMETCMHLKHFPHTALECIPLDREIGDMAPIYFKKAMQDAGPEWNSNKKVVDLSKKDIRHSVPKGFPYFAVDFGLQGGYAHVIEDEATFPFYFGREIVGGMIDAEPGLWRKPHREGFEEQRKKVLEFEQWWKPYDFTS